MRSAFAMSDRASMPASACRLLVGSVAKVCARFSPRRLVKIAAKSAVPTVEPNDRKNTLADVAMPMSDGSTALWAATRRG